MFVKNITPNIILESHCANLPLPGPMHWYHCVESYFTFPKFLYEA